MAFVVWIIALFATAIGVILAEVLLSLDIINADEIITALVWFLITYITYMGGKRVSDESWFKLLSVNYVVTWVFCSIGAVLGFVVWVLVDSGSVSLDLEALVNYFFFILPYTIGPTLAMSLGLRD